jgi:DNA-binding LacI/PurR family transcriptional regulator
MKTMPTDREAVTGATLNDVAARAGVSVASVSKVLNNRAGVSSENRVRVQKAMEDLGYQRRGARAPAPAERMTILTLDQYVNDDHFYGAILRALIDEGAAQGYRVEIELLPTSSPGVFDRVPDSLRSIKPDTVVLLGLDRPELLDIVAGFNRPAVIVNGMDPQMRIDSISPDFHFGGWTATKHLISLGHRDIVHITHPYRQSIARRLDGFRDALADSGIDFDPTRHVLDLKSPRRFNVAARDYVEEHIAANGLKATAFFCVTDLVALGTIQALTARGIRVPEDVSVVGFDDLPISSHSLPMLTTMRIERAELGHLAVRMLAERAARPEGSVRRVGLGVRLVERASTAPLVSA